MNLNDLLLVASSALSLACTIYLARHYIRTRNKITLLLFVFFAMFSLTWLGYLLISNGVFEFDIVTYILYVSLVDFGVILLIGLAMIKLRELFLLPASILLIAYFHEYALSASRDQLINSIQFLLYINYGQVLGNPLYIVIGDIMNGPPQVLYSEILDLLFNPLSVIIPRIDLTIISIYLLVISAPTIVLFYYLSWKNRSGRSLGFAIGLTVLNLNLFFGLSEDIIAITTVVATVFFALGIFGIFDRIAKTGSQETKKVVTK
ncbi:MAG: hypothetical protein WED07_01905 [Candidatus Freyarchaeum deiterrae]